MISGCEVEGTGLIYQQWQGSRNINPPPSVVWGKKGVDIRSIPLFGMKSRIDFDGSGVAADAGGGGGDGARGRRWGCGREYILTWQWLANFFPTSFLSVNSHSHLILSTPHSITVNPSLCGQVLAFVRAIRAGAGGQALRGLAAYGQGQAMRRESG